MLTANPPLKLARCFAQSSTAKAPGSALSNRVALLRTRAQLNAGVRWL